MNWTSLYGNSASAYHAQAKAALDRGCLVIACMGKGLWTSSGHFVLVWKIAGNVVYINDPASTRAARTRGDYGLFRSQVKYYFVIEKPVSSLDTTEREDKLNMTIDEMIERVTDEQAYKLLFKALEYTETLPEPEWSKQEGHWQRAVEAGIVDGSAPERPMKRDEVIAVLGRRGVIEKS